MKIALDCRLLDKNKNTGISRYTEFLIKFYRETFPDSDLFLITSISNLSYPGCLVIFTRLKPFSLLDQFCFTFLMRRYDFQLLHVPFYSGPFFKMYRTKVIITIHDVMFSFVPDFFGGNWFLSGLKKAYFNFLVGRSLKNADLLITVSKTTKDDVLTLFDMHSEVIPENSHLTGGLDDDILERFELKPKSYFFYCGNNRAHKNLMFIKNIFSSQIKLPNLVIAGSHLSSDDNVIALGVVTDHELRTLYANAIAFIFPSKYEGFGLPILESLYLKTPVIASNIPAFREFINPNIFYFELDNKNSFLKAVEKVQVHDFIDDIKFFEAYDDSKICQLLFTKIDELFLNCLK